MKLVGNTSILATGLLLAGMLGACQNEHENALIPQAPTTDSDRNAKTQGVGKLIKDGNVSLAYGNQDPSALWKEISDNGAHHEFTYGPQLITGKRYINGFPNPTMTFTYTLDASGRCTQTVTNKTHLYEYNESGQLKKYYNKLQPNERTEFTYTPDADGITNALFAVTFYDAAGTKTRELWFNYSLTEPIADKSPLNPDVFPTGVSKYIPVFGKFSNNLVQCSADKKFSNGKQISNINYYHTYTLDYAGKVKNATVKKYDGTLISTTDRAYTVPYYKF
ncbi:hypothetical protein SAMN04487996_12980 [Dyadobacter soli]|uniref:YD repeat-containing protein n=1 Tax=Dyadobacter soli TaxID=659014 RepID=A0A1G8A2T9_9BACT|nr:hypothetical protein [Dyadobacter soli]SDH14740.1 hypothetical protein SAMN04487996_12980 [Dyadobacter soli]